ncbi:MAG: Serine acetyltransferase [Firmicutes bacterium ADurb.Bin506]|jgi:serine O-acetyltransferase|nr:MAG: Serine acetyltransferase [Firmicutes bacterium ADurb.Bin506]
MLSLLGSYINAAMERDPAARSRLEVALLYPGVHALGWHLISHWLYRHNARGLARALSQLVRFFTGIEIHPGATIGRGVFIDHGIGVVIGETAVVGNDVTLYQGVTLGGTGKETGKRHPTIEDGVVVSAGATVLGSITIGARCKIGAGAVVIHNVPPDSTVVGVPGRVVARAGVKISPAGGPGSVLEHGDLPDPVGRTLEMLLRKVHMLEADVAALRSGVGPEAPASTGAMHDQYETHATEEDTANAGIS